MTRKVSVKTVNKWRAEALQTLEALEKVWYIPDHASEPFLSKAGTKTICERILLLTQQLQDDHILRLYRKKGS